MRRPGRWTLAATNSGAWALSRGRRPTKAPHTRGFRMRRRGLEPPPGYPGPGPQPCKPAHQIRPMRPGRPGLRTEWTDLDVAADVATSQGGWPSAPLATWDPSSRPQRPNYRARLRAAEAEVGQRDGVIGASVPKWIAGTGSTPNASPARSPTPADLRSGPTSRAMRRRRSTGRREDQGEGGQRSRPC